MLNDDERKILRVLFNLYRQDWVQLNLDDLCRYTGRSPGRVKAATRNLIEKKFIEVKDKEMRIIKAWEDFNYKKVK